MMRILKYLLRSHEPQNTSGELPDIKLSSYSIVSTEVEQLKPKISTVIEVGEVAYFAQQRAEASTHDSVYTTGKILS